MGSVCQHYLLAQIFVFALQALLPLRQCPFYMSAFFGSHAPLVFPSSLSPPCLVGVFAMGSPCRVDFVSDLDRNEDSLRTFPSGWPQAFAMGSPVSGRVALFCALDRNECFFRSSILRCFAMGPPCGSCVFFSHSIVTTSTLDS